MPRPARSEPGLGAGRGPGVAPGPGPPGRSLSPAAELNAGRDHARTSEFISNLNVTVIHCRSPSRRGRLRLALRVGRRRMAAPPASRSHGRPCAGPASLASREWLRRPPPRRQAGRPISQAPTTMVLARWRPPSRGSDRGQGATQPWNVTVTQFPSQPETKAETTAGHGPESRQQPATLPVPPSNVSVSAESESESRSQTGTAPVTAEDVGYGLDRSTPCRHPPTVTRFCRAPYSIRRRYAYTAGSLESASQPAVSPGPGRQDGAYNMPCWGIEDDRPPGISVQYKEPTQTRGAAAPCQGTCTARQSESEERRDAR